MSVQQNPLDPTPTFRVGKTLEATGFALVAFLVFQRPPFGISLAF